MFLPLLSYFSLCVGAKYTWVFFQFVTVPVALNVLGIALKVDMCQTIRRNKTQVFYFLTETE